MYAQSVLTQRRMRMHVMTAGYCLLRQPPPACNVIVVATLLVLVPVPVLVLVLDLAALVPLLVWTLMTALLMSRLPSARRRRQCPSRRYLWRWRAWLRIAVG